MATYPNIVRVSDLDTATPAATETVDKLPDSIRQIKYFLSQYLLRAHDDIGDVKDEGIYDGAQIRDGTVGTDQLGPGVVTASKIATGTITTTQLASDAVETTNIKNNAVTTGKIADGTIVNADISPTADIDGTKLLDASVPLAKLGSLTGITLPGGSITGAMLTANCVYPSHLRASTADDLGGRVPTTANPCLHVTLGSNNTKVMPLSGVTATVTGTSTTDYALSLAVTASSGGGFTDVTNLRAYCARYVESGVTSSVLIGTGTAVTSPAGWTNIRGPWGPDTIASPAASLLVLGGGSKQFTVTATGTYRIYFRMGSVGTDVAISCLYNITSPASYVGSLALSPRGYATQVYSVYDGFASFTAGDVFEIRTWAWYTGSTGGYEDSLHNSFSTASGVNLIFGEFVLQRII